MKKIVLSLLLLLLMVCTLACSKKYVVSFETNGGSLIESVEVESGSKVSKPTNPIKNGYSFNYWFCDKDLTDKYDFNTLVKSDITLYAGWTEAEEVIYTVTFGEDVVNVVGGQTVSEPTDPIKEGYIFVAWYTDEALTTKYDFNTPVTANIVLYPSWEEVVEYVVTFNTNGGTTIKPVQVADEEKIVKPTDPEKEDCIFEGWYTDAALTNEYDFNSKVSGNIVLYAKWTEIYRIVVFAVSMPNNYQTFLDNRAEQKNKRTEFMDLLQAYMIGDDNAWSAEPVLTFIKFNTLDKTYEEISVESWEFEIKLQILKGNEFVDVKDVNEYVDSIDFVNCTVDFKESAIGNTFNVIVIPTGLTEKQEQNIEKYTVSLEVNVIDGYNVYDEKELAYIDNRTTAEIFDDSDRTVATAWNAFKESNNLKLNYVPSAVILQCDLELTAADVPSIFFYTEEEVAGASDYQRTLGSMKDYYVFYFRYMGDDEEFHIYGNYYTLNSESFREVTRANGDITPEGEVISHATLIRLDGSETGITSIENLNIFGNAPRVENVVKAGGQIFLKVEGPSFTAYNNIAASMFITYMPNYTFKPFVMEKCKVYDAFNSFVYNWGSCEVYIKECEMIGAGGPVIIQDHVDSTATDGGRIAKTYIENSKLESYVTGSEGWFSVVGASAMVPGIVGLNNLFTPFGKSFLKNSSDGTLKYMNLICVNKSGSSESITAEKIKGSLKIDDYAAFDFGETNPYIAAMLETTFTQGAPAFQTSSSTLSDGYAYTDGATGIFDLTNTQIVDPANAIYSGDYLCIYYMGMAFTFGYFASGEIYTLISE